MPRYGDLEHVEKFVSDMINRSEVGYAGVQILSELYAMPTADVVEVRCKGCKYFVSEVCRHDFAMNLSRGDDFCSYGERRNDG